MFLGISSKNNNTPYIRSLGDKVSELTIKLEESIRREQELREDYSELAKIAITRNFEDEAVIEMEINENDERKEG